MEGKELKTLRNKLQMSQEALANALGAKPSQISKWESGKVKMGKLYREKIEKIMGDHGIQAS